MIQHKPHNNIPQESVLNSVVTTKGMTLIFRHDHFLVTVRIICARLFFFLLVQTVFDSSLEMSSIYKETHLGAK